LGHELKLVPSNDLAMVIANINVNGYRFWDELLKQGVKFSDGVEDEISKILEPYRLDEKIKDIIE